MGKMKYHKAIADGKLLDWFLERYTTVSKEARKAQRKLESLRESIEKQITKIEHERETLQTSVSGLKKGVLPKNVHVCPICGTPIFVKHRAKAIGVTSRSYRCPNCQTHFSVVIHRD